MIDFTTLLDDPATSIAVVGATDDPTKFGNEIYRDLRAKGYRVFAVNPGRTTAAGDPCWPDLRSLPERPTIVNLVTPPPATLRVLGEARDLGLFTVWVQPGAADDAVHRLVAAEGFTGLIDACIMMRSRHHAG